MTQVRIALSVPTSDGAGKRPTGTVSFKPTKRRTVGDDVVLPAAFTAAVTEPPTVITVAPTEPGWAWEVVERVSGGSPHKRVLAVPDSASVIDYADLVEVDPATLDPVTLTNAWQSYVDTRAVPGGGTTGQVLAKASSTDRDTHWIDQTGGGAVASVNGHTGTVVLAASDVGAQPAGSYATAAQGAKADSAVQPGSLATVATSGAYADLTGSPTAANYGPGGSLDLTSLFSQLRGPLPPGTWVPPKVVTDCESGVINDSGAGNGTVAHDATVARFGSNSVKITPVGNGNAAKATFALSTQDWTNDGLNFWVRSDDWASLIDAYLLISTNGAFASFFICQIRPMIARPTNNEWMQVSFTRGDFTVGSGTPTWSTVNRVMVQAYSATSTTPNLWVDQFERSRGSRRGVVAIGFDDGFATTSTIAKPYMDKYGFRATANIILGRIGTTGYMTQAQIDDLADAGWDISGHAENDLTTLTFSAAEADVKAIKAYLDDKNYKGRGVYAYALGGQNIALRQMVRKYFAAARGTSTGGQYLSRLMPSNFTARQAGKAISVATMTGWIDQAAADGRFLPLIFHNLPTTTVANEDVLPADFRSVMDYLATANVDVLTISEALVRGPWGPKEPPVFVSANGTHYVLTVGDDGALTTTALT